MALSISDIAEVGVGFLSLFGGFPKAIAPPEDAAKWWTGLASVIAAVAFVLVKLSHVTANLLTLRILTAVCLATAIVLCIRYIDSLENLTVDYDGGKRIAGTVYTPAADAYKLANPALTREQMLFNFTGVPDLVWTPDSIAASRRSLARRYSLVIALLAFGLYLAIELLAAPLPENKPVAPPSPPAATLQDVHFPLDRSEIEQDASERLEADAATLKDILKRHPNATIIVEGHCDDSGTEAHNLTLGYDRARAVMDQLARDGVPLGSLQAASYGKGPPLVCGDGDESCRRRNRRVHLTVAEPLNPAPAP